MKKVLRNIIIPNLVILNIIFLGISEAYASSNVPNNNTRLEQFISDLGNITTLSDAFNFVKRTVGFGGVILGNDSDFNNITRLNELDQYITGKLSDEGNNNPSEQEKVEYFKDQYEVNEDDVTVKDGLKTKIINITNNYISSDGYYIGYTYDISSIGNYFGTKYSSLCEMVEMYQDNYNVILYGDNLFIISKNNYKAIYADNFGGPDNYFIGYYSIVDGSVVNFPWRNAFKQFRFNYNANVNAFEEVSVGGSNDIIGSFISSNLENNVGYNNFYSGYQYLLTFERRESYKIYRSLALVPSSGRAPYYYNNDVWQDFSTSQGDYTFSPSNINSVTYGDVINYQDQYYDDHGYYPDQSQVNNYIDNTHNENINNSGGGSGDGDGDGEGGGSGDGDGIGDIFGWLKGLGSAIASLIKGLGEFLTEIIAGLTEAITELLSGISNLIISVTETIPSAFMDFLHACFDWMPDEWVGLFGACVLVMVLYGIIKLIRG